MRPMGAAAYGGKGFKERARVSGERPIGAASCRQQYNEASCQAPPPPPPTSTLSLYGIPLLPLSRGNFVVYCVGRGDRPADGRFLCACVEGREVGGLLSQPHAHKIQVGTAAPERAGVSFPGGWVAGVGRLSLLFGFFDN